MAGQIVAILGGGGFVGKAIGRALLDCRADVFCLNRRGESGDPDIAGVRVDRRNPLQVIDVLDRLQADITIDCIGLIESDTLPLVDALNARGGRFVFVSSVDVYAAFGRVLGTEPGRVDTRPLSETSPLRSVLRPYSSIEGRAEYDKIPLEDHVLGATRLDSRIARLPAMFGPNDPRRRFKDVVSAALAGSSLEMPMDLARWRFDMLFIDDAGRGVAQLALADAPDSAVFHFGPDDHATQFEVKKRFARANGFELAISLTEDAGEYRQDIVFDSSMAREKLGWMPQTDIDDAYRATWEWEAEQQAAVG